MSEAGDHFINAWGVSTTDVELRKVNKTIDSIVTRVNALEVGVPPADLTPLQDDIAALDTQVNGLNSSVVALDGAVAGLGVTVGGLATTVGVHQSSINSLNSTTTTQGNHIGTIQDYLDKAIGFDKFNPSTIQTPPVTWTATTSTFDITNGTMKANKVSIDASGAGSDAELTNNGSALVSSHGVRAPSVMVDGGTSGGTYATISYSDSTATLSINKAINVSSSIKASTMEASGQIKAEKFVVDGAVAGGGTAELTYDDSTSKASLNKALSVNDYVSTDRLKATYYEVNSTTGTKATITYSDAAGLGIDKKIKVEGKEVADPYSLQLAAPCRMECKTTYGGTTYLFTVDSTDNAVGIGTNTSATKPYILQVKGNSTFDGLIQADKLSVTNSIKSSSIADPAMTCSSAGDMILTGQKFKLNDIQLDTSGTSMLDIAATVRMRELRIDNNSLTEYAAMTYSTVTNTLDVNKAVKVDKLVIDGSASSVGNANMTFVTAGVSFDKPLNITGGVQCTGLLKTSGDLNIQGGAQITGATALTGTVTCSGNLVVAGTITNSALQGQITAVENQAVAAQNTANSAVATAGNANSTAAAAMAAAGTAQTTASTALAVASAVTNGVDGVGISSVTQESSYTMRVTKTDGSYHDLTLYQGPSGAAGAAGADGVGISSVTQPNSVTMRVTKTNGVSTDLTLPMSSLASSAPGDFLVTGTLTTSNLVVLGSNTTVNSYSTVSSNLIIDNQIGTGPALYVAQKGIGSNYPIADFYDRDDLTKPAMRIADGGNIYLGRSTGSNMLEIAGGINAANNVGKHIRLTTTSTLDTAGYIWTDLKTRTDSTGYARFVIETNSDGRYTATVKEQVSVVYNTGRVGIGSTAPTQKLDVNGTIRSGGVIMDTGYMVLGRSDNANQGLLEIAGCAYGALTTGKHIRLSNTATLNTATYQYSDIKSKTDSGLVTRLAFDVCANGTGASTEAISIAYATGRVGIGGKIDPQYPLDVSGTARATAFMGDGSALTSLNAGNITTGTLDSNRLATSGVTAGTYGDTVTVPVISVDDKGRVTSVTTAGIPVSTSDTNIEIFTGSGSSTTVGPSAINWTEPSTNTFCQNVPTTQTNAGYYQSGSTVNGNLIYSYGCYVATSAASTSVPIYNGNGTASSFTGALVATTGHFGYIIVQDKTTGTVQQFTQIAGSGTSRACSFNSISFIDNGSFIVTGTYTSNYSIMIRNMDNTNSAISLPSTSNNIWQFIIWYNSSGVPQTYCTLQATNTAGTGPVYALWAKNILNGGTYRLGVYGAVYSSTIVPAINSDGSTYVRSPRGAQPFPIIGILNLNTSTYAMTWQGFVDWTSAGTMTGIAAGLCLDPVRNRLWVHGAFACTNASVTIKSIALSTSSFTGTTVASTFIVVIDLSTYEFNYIQQDTGVGSIIGNVASPFPCLYDAYDQSIVMGQLCSAKTNPTYLKNINNTNSAYSRTRTNTTTFGNILVKYDAASGTCVGFFDTIVNANSPYMDADVTESSIIFLTNIKYTTGTQAAYNFDGTTSGQTIPTMANQYPNIFIFSKQTKKLVRMTNFTTSTLLSTIKYFENEGAVLVGGVTNNLTASTTIISPFNTSTTYTSTIAAGLTTANALNYIFRYNLLKIAAPSINHLVKRIYQVSANPATYSEIVFSAAANANAVSKLVATIFASKTSYQISYIGSTADKWIEL